jgi:tRNA(Ile)-lysidine synthetase-like protein
LVKVTGRIEGDGGFDCDDECAAHDSSCDGWCDHLFFHANGCLAWTRERVHEPSALDLDALGVCLRISWRRGGERLRVRPGGARRALKSLLQEARVPPAERARLPLLFRDGELVAAADLWIDASVRARGAARRRARLIWHKAPHAPR